MQTDRDAHAHTETPALPFFMNVHILRCKNNIQTHNFTQKKPFSEPPLQMLHSEASTVKPSPCFNPSSQSNVLKQLWTSFSIKYDVWPKFWRIFFWILDLTTGCAQKLTHCQALTQPFKSYSMKSFQRACEAAIQVLSSSHSRSFYNERQPTQAINPTRISFKPPL